MKYLTTIILPFWGICFLLITNTGYAQSRYFEKSDYKKNGVIAESFNKPVKGSNESSRHNLVSKKYLQSQDGIMVFTDTLNYPLPGELTLYVSDEGYVSGNNEYNDQAKANFFTNSMSCYLTGVLIDFAWATGGDENIEVAVWNNNGSGDSPGDKIGSSSVLLNEIIQNVGNEELTYIPFLPAVEITGNFYVGVYLPETAGDTLAIWTNTDGDTNPATAWELWDSGEWFNYGDQNSWQLNVAHAIYPVVTDEVDLTANFVAGETGISPGETVGFQDLSLGTPISWMWEFEGGTPSTSTEQNPVVSYEQTGNFDVKLIVNDGSMSDSITKPDYIHVSEQVPNIDTLIYPLPGSYVVFVLNNNGGYVCGTNSFGDQVKANYFGNIQEGELTGMLIEYAWASGGNPDVEVSVWSADSGVPTSKIGSSTVSFSTIKNDVNAQQPTFVNFDNDISVQGSFFAGFSIPQTAGDTIVVWSNDNGDTNPGIAWEVWDDNTWHNFNEQNSWQINCALAIHPIIEYPTGIFEILGTNQLNVYPNPSNGVYILDIENISNPTNLEVFDVNGNLVSRQKVFAENMQTVVKITNQKAGVYLIRLQSDSGYRYTRIVKE
ncbi:MAG: T9SS type A sorting domain-containing protein [Bacteroidales bacterium]|nr:T9SS type A sorting domain-containing protein [Bacteroidales bacterium]